MEDSEIIQLYWDRSEQAIAETSGKYGSFLCRIAWNILRSHDDAEECVNDTYLRTWNAIPPARPGAFRTWLGRITRNLSLDRWNRERAQKRGGDEHSAAAGRAGILCSIPPPDGAAPGRPGPGRPHQFFFAGSAQREPGDLPQTLLVRREPGIHCGVPWMQQRKGEVLSLPHPRKTPDLPGTGGQYL